MTILDDFMQYVDKNGLIAPTIGGGSNNGLLYTAISLIVLKDNQVLDAPTFTYFYGNMAACGVKDERGLFFRSPGNTDQEAPDDYVGLCATGVLGFDFPKSILYYGWKHYFNYNNQTPNKFTLDTFFARQPQLIAHMYHGSKIVPPLLLRLYWALAVIYSAFADKKNQDAWMLSWLLIRTWKALHAFSLPCWIASKFWTWRMYKHFPNGLKDLPYLEGSTTHPITKYWML